jgi:ribonuclease HI
MWVTAYCDASFARVGRERHGGWAVWLRSSAGRLTRQGVCPPWVRDSVAAELAAIFAAVHLSVVTWRGVAGVLVCSDCQPALDLAAFQRTATAGGSRRLQERLRALTITHEVAIHMRWVKGHRRPSAGTSAFLNDWCDRSAKASRRAKR